MKRTAVFAGLGTKQPLAGAPRRIPFKSCRGLPCVFLGGLLASQASAESLADLPIEQLMNESVTSASRKETLLNQAPTAISVITGDDIRRLGITSIPEALRLVPGLDVARVSANQWAISSRGFNLQYANKLLVMMDGRSVYTPSFGGVIWDAQDMMLEDLDRIEVIRGPGATLWGANAVNGVINITSKNAKDTQGFLGSTSFGTEDQPSVNLRYGGALGADLHYRVYAKGFNRDGLVDSAGNDTPGAWDSLRGGFRVDWQPNGEDLVTLQGDYYSIDTGGTVTVPVLAAPFSRTSETDGSSKGGNLLGRWTRTLSEDSQFSIQAYYDHFENDPGLTAETRDTGDIQFEHRFPLNTRNDIVWGLGYRFTTDEFENSETLSFSPASADLNLYSAFIQDEITLVPDRLRLILGSKFEHNDFTGFEVQPGLRLLWTPTDKQTVWAAASRAVSTPSRFDRGGRLATSAFQPPASPVVTTSFVGTPGFGSESLYAYELGYRIKPAENLSFDLTGFYNVYDDATGSVVGKPAFETDPSPHLEVPIYSYNSESGHTFGAEASVQWLPREWWRLTANYSWLEARMEPSGLLTRGSPEQQVSLRSYITLPWNLEFNSFASYVDQIDTLNNRGTTTAIPAYVRVDAGLIWRASESLEVGLWGQNLLDKQHPEFTSTNSSVLVQVPRSAAVKLTWRY